MRLETSARDCEARLVRPACTGEAARASTALRPDQQLVDLAKRVVEVLASMTPKQPQEGRFRARDQLILDGAHGVAEAAGFDIRRLDRAIGPEIEVGSNPSWRALLQTARQICLLRSQVTRRGQTAGRVIAFPASCPRSGEGALVSAGRF